MIDCNDALCIGLDQTACGSASGCAWESNGQYVTKHGESSQSRDAYCYSTVCDAHKSAESSCTSTSGCIWGKVRYTSGDGLMNHYNSAASSCAEEIACALSGCSYESLGCTHVDGYSGENKAGETAPWHVDDNYILCSYISSPSDKIEAFPTGSIYINNLPSTTKAFLCYGCQISYIDKRTFQGLNGLKKVELSYSNLAFLESNTFDVSILLFFY